MAKTEIGPQELKENAENRSCERNELSEEELGQVAGGIATGVKRLTRDSAPKADSDVLTDRDLTAV